LRIYVYRDGLARFCSEPADSPTKFGKITNVGFNVPHAEIADISRIISAVFAGLAAKGVDVAAIWRRIDEIVFLTVLAGLPYLEQAQRAHCPAYGGYSRCFQLLGFDVLLDRALRPWVLEVNYRPSLDFHRPVERRMKVAMLRDLVRIALPYNLLQESLRVRKWGWTADGWTAFLKDNPQLLADALDRRQTAIELGNFVPVCPTKDSPQKKLFMQIYQTVQIFATSRLPAFLAAVGQPDGSGGEEV
jgi:hypothetical protein